jgi:hypothetical protein
VTSSGVQPEVRKAVERALSGEIKGFADWLSKHFPLTGDWWGADEWIVDPYSVERALRQYLSGEATHRDLTTWASLLTLGGSRGPAPPGKYLLIIPVEYDHRHEVVLADIVRAIEFHDVDGFDEEDARRSLERLNALPP